MSTGEPSVVVRGVTKTFGSVRALRGVDLTFPGGGIYGVVGPNGSGKTTLFGVMCGFLKPDAGTVTLSGQDITPGTPPAKGRVAILPQDARFLSHVSVEDHLVYYGRLGGLDPASAKTRAREVLEMVDLTKAARRTPDTLSHGMRKRVGIAQAFLGHADVIILDEPSAGLDPNAARDIHAMIRRARDNQTVIVSSHDLDEVQDLCTEVAILKQGECIRHEKIAELLGEGGEVSFRMGDPPSDEVVQKLRAHFPWVQKAFWDVDLGRLRVFFDPGQKAADAAGGEIVAFLVAEKVTFLEMQVGKSLEDRFVEETHKHR